MKTDNGLAIAFFAVVIGGAVALAIANDITAPICKAAAEAVPKDKFDFGCVEFWLNRYQTLLSAGVAAAVALIVVRPVLKQLREMTRQSAKGAKEIAENLAHALEHELDAVNEALRLSFFLNASLDRTQLTGPRGWAEFEEPRVRQARIDALVEQVTRSSRRAIGGKEIVALREAYLPAAGLLKHLVEIAETVRDMNASGTGSASPNPDYESIDAVHNAWAAFAEAHNALSRALDQKIRQLWHRVNELTDEADGGHLRCSKSG